MLKKATAPARPENELTSIPAAEMHRRFDTQNLPANRVRVPADAEMPLGACHGH